MHDTFTVKAICPRCGAVLPPPWPPPGGRGRCPSCGEELHAKSPARGVFDASQAHAEADTSQLLIGKTLGGCRLLALVGRGAMGHVYQARQLSLDRIVAVKTIRPELCADPEVLARFQAEARTIGLFRTEHVVQVHDVGFEDGIHFIVMEFVGGGHLGQYAESLPEKRLSSEDGIRFLIQAARGLLEAERLGIVHRDIKPGNLLLDETKRLKIADFGIAKALGEGHQTLFGSGCLVGTPIYMSPEQGRGEQLDHRSDMYSLGATFYHLLTGQRPVQGTSVYEVIRWKNQMKCLSAPELAREGELSKRLARIIERMTAQRPSDRYQSFADVIAEAEDLAQTQPRLSARRPRRRPSPSRILRAFAGALAAIAILCAAGFFLAPRDFWGGARPEPERKTSVATKAPAPAPATPAPAEAPAGALEQPKTEPSAAATEEWTRRAAVLAALKPPRDLKPPLRDALDYWREIEPLLSPPETAGKEFRAWLEAEAQRRSGELCRSLEAPVQSLLRTAAEEKERFLRWETSIPAYESVLKLVEETRATLEALPGEVQRCAAELVPASLLSEARTVIERRAALEEKLRAAASSAEEIERRVGNVRDLAGVETELRGDLASALQSAIAEIEAIQKEVPSAPLGAAFEKLSRASAALDSWRAAVRLRDEALEALEARALQRAARAAGELRSQAIAEALAEKISSAVSEFEAGFRQALEDLDPQGARERFSKAASAVAEFAPGSTAESWARSCAERAGKLAALSENMAPVKRGEVLALGTQDGKTVTVEPFFIDRFETSVKEYQEFAAQHSKFESYEEARALWRDPEAFERFGHKERIEPRYLSELEGVDPSWPIEEVSYFQAEACLRYLGKDLPTVEEWFLAARGPLEGGKYLFDAPSIDVHRNPERPAPVRRGAAARAFPTRHSVHHLAGNVAEWCKAPGDATKAYLIGGSYLDSDPRRLSGERRDFVPLGTQRRGYGFRGVLRPRELFADLMPVADSSASAR